MKSSPSSEVLSINDVKPYWRNPRIISDEAIEAVRASLAEFGYVQPIVVDHESVIVIGHTRYTAMRRLGIEEVEVLRVDLPPEKVKELRIIDNRSAEYAWWDREKLKQELAGDADDELMTMLFPEAKAPEDEVDIEAFAALDEQIDNGPTPVEFVCPSCFHEWEVAVTREQILSGLIETEMAP